MLYACEPGKPAHGETELLRFNRFDEIRPDQRAAGTMKELDLCHVAARNGQGEDFPAPWAIRVSIQCQSVEINVIADLVLAARGAIDLRIREGSAPHGYPPVGDAVQPDNPARRTYALNLALETAGQRCGGMNEQLVAGATDAGHPGREWHLGPRRSEANNWAINNPYLLRHPLERIERRVSRIAHLLTRASSEHSSLPCLALVASGGKRQCRIILRCRSGADAQSPQSPASSSDAPAAIQGLASLSHSNRRVPASS